MSARAFVRRRFFSQQRTPSPTQWQQYKPYLPTYATIGVCCSAYAYNLYADYAVKNKRNFRHRDFIDKNLIFDRVNYNAGRWWTMVTYSFMHTTGLHLAANMFVLSSFGPLSVALFGLPTTAALWLGGSVSAIKLSMIGEDFKKKKMDSGLAPTQITIQGRALPRGKPENEENIRHLGASGSMLSILAAIACRIPQHGVYIFPIPASIPIYGALGGFAFMSAVAYTQDLVPLFGHAGHLGGMAFGLFYYVLALRNKRFPKL
ncbi:MAG: hypothetical protein L6R40_004825 [Gallowayella cf. fulva]|nr:MAG: hypothetical protein L6R40_004825 [Xanthomendoza cf. fulva]